MFIATAILCLWMVSGARAASLQVAEIKTLPSTTGETVEISLSGEIAENQIAAEFQRNFLQLSIRGASAFPAKNSNVNGQQIDKVFVYQYQPDLTRARILFKKDVASIQNQIHWEVKGSKIFVRLNNGAQPLPVAKLAPVRTLGKSSPVAKVHTDKLSQVASSNEKPALNDPLAKEDARLIEAILDEPASKPAAPAIAAVTDAAAKSRENEALFADSPKKESKVNSSKPVSPITRMVSGLLTVLAIMALVAFGFKKFVLQGRLGLSRQGRMVDMVSSYMLSPKKQIAVVRVGKQYMVLGVTDSQINLIQNLGEDATIEKFMDEVPPTGRGGGNSLGFDSILRTQVSSTDARRIEELEEPVAEVKPSFRSLIKQRIEGFKPL